MTPRENCRILAKLHGTGFPLVSPTWTQFSHGNVTKRPTSSRAPNIGDTTRTTGGKTGDIPRISDRPGDHYPIISMLRFNGSTEEPMCSGGGSI